MRTSNLPSVIKFIENQKANSGGDHSTRALKKMAKRTLASAVSLMSEDENEVEATTSMTIKSASRSVRFFQSRLQASEAETVQVSPRRSKCGADVVILGPFF